MYGGGIWRLIICFYRKKVSGSSVAVCRIRQLKISITLDGSTWDEFPVFDSSKPSYVKLLKTVFFSN